MSTNDFHGAYEIALPLDLLLTTSAIGMASRMVPDSSWSRFGWNLARRPGVVGQRVRSLGRELASITWGSSDRVPVKADKRFNDPAWQGNPLMKRSMQAYLAANDTVDKLFGDANLDWRDAERLRFVLNVVMEGIAPSNNPVISPLRLEGDHRHRRLERRSRGAARPRDIRHTCALDGGPGRLHGRRDPCGHARGSRVPQRGFRTDPVHPARPKRCTQYHF